MNYSSLFPLFFRQFFYFPSFFLPFPVSLSPSIPEFVLPFLHVLLVSVFFLSVVFVSLQLLASFFLPSVRSFYSLFLFLR